MSRNRNLKNCLVGFQSNQRLSIISSGTLCIAGEKIGTITSWGYSYWLKKTIGFAHVKPQNAISGTTAWVDSNEGKAEVTMTNRRFYQNLLFS